MNDDRTVLAGNSLTGSLWTTVSRLTGFVRVAAVAAVLGPTYFGNTYQATNLLPNLTYEFLTGALFASLLVPVLVSHVDTKDTRSTARLSGGFLGIVLVAFTVVTLFVIAIGPLVLRILSAGVEDPAVAEDQRRVGWLLIAMLMPQVLFYGVAATAGAVMNAHGRFALAAAAPALENVGIIVTMASVALLFGTGLSLDGVTTSQLLVLGLGTTGSVALHAAVQWWGARRAGVTLVPLPGWRDPEVRKLVRHAVPSLGYAGLNSLRVFAVLVVANKVPGGVIAFQLALNFFHLPTAVWARPTALALLPQLSRLHLDGQTRRFGDELQRGAVLVFFLILPAAVAYAVLAVPLARAASFGEMATVTGVSLVAASLFALAPGVVGESGFVVGTQASFARGDAVTPLRAMVLRTAIAMVGTGAAYAFSGEAVLLTLGVAISGSNLAAALYLGRALRSDAWTAGTLTPSLVRGLVASSLMVIPAYLVAVSARDLMGPPVGDLVAVLAAVAVGLVIFLGVQVAWRSPELTLLRQGLPGAESRRERSLRRED